MNPLRRSGYTLIALGAFNVWLSVRGDRLAGHTHWLGWITVVFCFVAGFYFLKKGWDDHGV